MTSTLTTERLELVPFLGRHQEFLHALWIDRDVRRYLWDDRIVSKQEVADVIEFSRANFAAHGFGFWHLARRDSGQPAGFAGLRHFGNDGEVEILYGLAPDHWRQGLATEASRRVLRFAFEEAGLEEVFAGADPPNARSFKVMDRLGFEHHGRRVIEGVETEYYCVNGQAFLGSDVP